MNSEKPCTSVKVVRLDDRSEYQMIIRTKNGWKPVSRVHVQPHDAADQADLIKFLEEGRTD